MWSAEARAASIAARQGGAAHQAGVNGLPSRMDEAKAKYADAKGKLDAAIKGMDSPGGTSDQLRGAVKGMRSGVGTGAVDAAGHFALLHWLTS